MSEVFLDTETTGLSFKEGHRIVEIACIETKDLIATGKTFHNFNQIESMPERTTWNFRKVLWIKKNLIFRTIFRFH